MEESALFIKSSRGYPGVFDSLALKLLQVIERILVHFMREILRLKFSNVTMPSFLKICVPESEDPSDNQAFGRNDRSSGKFGVYSGGGLLQPGYSNHTQAKIEY